MAVENERLPAWDLSPFYGFDGDVKNIKTLDDLYTQNVKQDITLLQDLSSSFEKSYRDHVQEKVTSLFDMLQEYERIDTIAGKIQTYSYLLYAKNTSHPLVLSFHQKCTETINDIYQNLLFFEVELGHIEDRFLNEVIKKDQRLSFYSFWIDHFRKRKAYQLTEKEEKILHAKRISGRDSWIRLFDETMSQMRFPVDGKMLTESETLHLLQNKEESIRKQVALSLGQTLKEKESLFALITNTLAKDKAVDDQLRGFKTPVSSRNLANTIEDSVVETLIETVKESYGSLSHRYYRLKAKILGKNRLNHWDRSAPLFHDDSVIPFSEAKHIVLDAYRSFIPEMATIAEGFFEGYIDAAPVDGKDGGAFSHPCVPELHPYILMNYHGNLRDVMTLAHELGHGVHQVLSAKRGYWGADTPLTVAETASVFGEMLTFKHLSKTLTGDQKRYLLASKIEDMIATVIRQTAFFDFEWRVHNARQKGEILPQDLHAMWMSVSKESLGDGVLLDEHYDAYWSYIPHFIHSPFYVYAYAFGDCLVNSLYRCYEEGMPDFKEKYLKMLSLGGTRYYTEMLSSFGLDPHQKSFWQGGLSVLEEMIVSLENTL